ncbi:MAG: hypothetical protein RL328_824 [Acidobacteriota bacterium]
MPELLTSEKNPLLKEIRKAAHRGSLTAEGLAVVEGPHLLEEAVRSRVKMRAVVVAESARVALPVTDARIFYVADAVFGGLSSTEAPQGILALVQPPSWRFADLLGAPALLAVLDGIQDPGNAGAILRAAEAFGATGAVFLKGTVNPFNPKALRASAGSVFRLPLVTGVTPQEFFELASMPLFAATPRAATVLADADLAQSCALVIGSEGRGVSQAVAARATGVRIPTEHVESLNASVAAGILMYEARRQRGSGSR